MFDIPRPNLFKYATKELSQDAMICWLIQWADDRYAGAGDDQALHALGRKFIGGLLGKHGATLPKSIESKIYQQDRGIDVLARIGPDHVLLIEDKTDTSDHGDQLKRYCKQVVEGQTQLGAVLEDSVYPIYLKTGNQSLHNDQRIEKETRYKVFNRSDLLDVLRTYQEQHSTLLDYRQHLKRWQRDTDNFNCWRQGQRAGWSWNSWQGFFRYMDDDVRRRNGWSDWGYVPNRSGGFLGLWWNWFPLDGNASIYLQLEVVVEDRCRQQLCLKLGDVEKSQRGDLQRFWHERVVEASGGKVVKPPRLRRGEFMTVGHWKDEWLAFREGRIDLEGTVRNLTEAEEVLKRAVNGLSAVVE